MAVLTPEEADALLGETPGYPAESNSSGSPKSKKPAILGALGLIILMLLGGFNLLYAGKVMPGVSVNGAYLGGLNRQQAQAAIDQRTQKFATVSVPVQLDGTTTTLKVENLDLEYDNTKGVEMALGFGRQGSLWDQAKAQARTLLGRPTNIATYRYDPHQLRSTLSQWAQTASAPVTNAGFSFDQEQVRIMPAQAGRRLDIGRMVMLIEERLAATSDRAIAAPVYDLEPAIDAISLRPVASQVRRYIAGPVTVKASGRESTVTPDKIVAWISVYRPVKTMHLFAPEAIYNVAEPVEVGIDEGQIGVFVADLAKRVDQPGQNAALSFEAGRATVFRPSRDGLTLDQPAAIKKIKASLTKAAANRQVALEVKVTKPAVTEESLNNLGIKELISEGVSYFPDSPPARMQNVRVGAARYNGVLVKPGETFSFGALLGEVSAATGYAPAKVILANRQEEQYGGGLCQVSSTAYRAALNAGLPILQRYNHSFAVSYYTDPYGVPGVDATIYYPQVDFKFRNDTGAHILIQTIMSGSTLKFQFYGTKVKEGKIRGPFFVSGSSDHTKPSHTVFYRDVIQNGQVVKTDTVHTYYKSSEEFPTQQQYN